MSKQAFHRDIDQIETPAKKRTNGSVIPEHWHKQRFTTYAAFWKYIEESIAEDEPDETLRAVRLAAMKERQEDRSQLIGEICTLKKAVHVNGSTVNPLWECEAIEPYGQKIKVVAWSEDIAAVTGDANSDPWAHGNEAKGLSIDSSPDNLNREFILVMDSGYNFRIDPLPKEVKA